MNFLLSFILVGLMSATALGRELAQVPLITPIAYEKDPKFYQYISSKIEVGAGHLVGIKIGKIIKAEVDPFKKDLNKYFPKESELNNLVESLTKDIEQNITKGNLDDGKVISIYAYLGKNLIGQIADRIFETEGVKDSKRRSMWVNKILEPFNSCVSRALNARYDAKHCMTALTAGLIPNIGTGLVYELTKANLSSSLPSSEQSAFTFTQVTHYQECLKSFLPTPKPDHVSACALNAMKNGIKSVTETKLGQTLNSSTSSSNIAKKIKNGVWPSYDICVQTVGSDKSNSTPLSEQFVSCVDQLIQKTGIQIVADKVENNSSLKLTFPEAELRALSKDQAAQFQKCTQSLIAKPNRKSGPIDTTTCETAITNDLYYQAVLRKFSQSALDQIKGTDISLSLLNQEGKKFLDQCWKQNQTPTQREACLRKAVIEFSKLIAEKRLEFAIPNDLPTKNKIKSDSLAVFKNCLEKRLPSNISEDNELSKKMDPCTSGLLLSATSTTVEDSVEQALTNNLSDSAKDHLNLSEQRNSIRAEVLGNFRKCLSENKNPDPCTDQVKKEATQSIALAAGRASRLIHVPKSSHPPEEYLAVEEDLKRCIFLPLIGEDLSKHLDECKKKFVIEVARNIGTEKFNATLKDLLGAKKFEESTIHTAIVLKNYNECLDNLYKDYKEVTFCTDQLSRDGELVFKENVNQWMSAEEKDAATLAIKSQFVDFLPCLGSLLPQGGNATIEKVEQDAAPFMEIVAKAIAQYIEYSPENAKQNLDDIIKQFAKDVHESADTVVARKNLVDLLYKNGAFDQFLKSYIRKIVSDSFASIPDSFLSKQLKDSLISKENFDAIFQGAEGKKVKDLVLEQLINPVVVEGKSSSSPEVIASMQNVTDKVTQMLINSPYFGEKIISSQIQGSLDNIGALKAFFVKVFYGGPNALNWQRVRLTPEGQRAENYIKENIMTPKFKMITMSTSEVDKRNKEAERLVTEAVKKYKEPRK